jgi:tetratricopeptide (TPR) repeat protein
MTLRPGLPAYSRVAALRTLFGDRRGAIEALELALDASDPSDPEQRAWILTYLGHEHWALGELDQAERRYADALAAFPDYHLALPGLARVRAAEGRIPEAIALYERALAVAPTPSVAGALGDAQAAAGDPAAARASYDFVVYMGHIATARGKTLGRELAVFLADHDRNLDEALRLARADAATRDDVYTSDALAWVLFKQGQLVRAKRAMARALRLGTEEAAFHYHAAMIAAALARPRAADRHLRTARALNPHLEVREAALAPGAPRGS